MDVAEISNPRQLVLSDHGTLYLPAKEPNIRTFDTSGGPLASITIPGFFPQHLVVENPNRLILASGQHEAVIVDSTGTIISDLGPILFPDHYPVSSLHQIFHSSDGGYVYLFDYELGECFFLATVDTDFNRIWISTSVGDCNGWLHRPSIIEDSNGYQQSGDHIRGTGVNGRGWKWLWSLMRTGALEM